MDTQPKNIVIVWCRRALIALFMLSIWLPLIDNVVGLDRSQPLKEKRNLAAIPDINFTWASIDAFPDSFDSYFNDHFGFRNFLIRRYYIQKVLWLKVSPIAPSNLAKPLGDSPDENSRLQPRVIVGKDGWLFFGEDGIVDDFRGILPLDDDDLVLWKKGLEERLRWGEQNGIKYMFVVIPNKHTIYPEYLPRHIHRVGEKTRLDQLVDFLKEYSLVEIVDLREPLMEAKKLGQVYQTTGTHLNDLGSWVAYSEIIKALKKWFPDLEPLPLSAFKREIKEINGKDLAWMLGMEEIIPEPYITLDPLKPYPYRVDEAEVEMDSRLLPFTATEITSSTLPRAMLCCDSFGGGLAPLLSNNFSRIAYYQMVNYTPDILKAEKPDVVITELVERTVVNYIPYNFPEVQRVGWYGGNVRHMLP